MVLLTMTSSIVEGLQLLTRATDPENDTNGAQGDGLEQPGTERGPEPGTEPSLKQPAVGNPVSHAQVVDLWKAIKDAGHREYTLERLLKGSTVYVLPPVPKPQPVSRVLPGEQHRVSSPPLTHYSRTSTSLSWPDFAGSRKSGSMSA